MDFLLVLHTCLWPIVKLLKLLVGGKPSQVWQPTKALASIMCKFELMYFESRLFQQTVN
jgi:hypothetical protein